MRRNCPEGTPYIVCEETHPRGLHVVSEEIDPRGPRIVSEEINLRGPPYSMQRN